MSFLIHIIKICPTRAVTCWSLQWLFCLFPWTTFVSYMSNNAQINKYHPIKQFNHDCSSCHSTIVFSSLTFYRFPQYSRSSQLWNDCAHRTHTRSPSQLWLAETSFSQAGDSSVFNPTLLLQNTENICRGGTSFLNTSPVRLYTVLYIFCRHLSMVHSILYYLIVKSSKFSFEYFLVGKDGLKASMGADISWIVVIVLES